MAEGAKGGQVKAEDGVQRVISLYCVPKNGMRHLLFVYCTPALDHERDNDGHREKGQGTKS